jgi:hypothetical protein
LERNLGIDIKEDSGDVSDGNTGHVIKSCRKDGLCYKVAKNLADCIVMSSGR